MLCGHIAAYSYCFFMLLYLLPLPKVSNRKTKTPFLRCKSVVFGMQKGGFYIVKVWFLFFECCVVAIRQQYYWQAVSSRRSRFIVPAYLYSTCICNPFETHSRNVRNVFVICVLYIRCVKVWFLRCKSMVFGVQKGGFYIAKVWFLQCKKGVFIFWLRHSYNVAMY